jgi:hypothetical protein
MMYVLTLCRRRSSQRRGFNSIFTLKHDVSQKWVAFVGFQFKQYLRKELVFFTQVKLILYKDKVSFKRFLLELSETCDSRLEKAMRRAMKANL